MGAALTAKRTTWQVMNLLTDWDALQPAWDEYVERHPKGSVFHTSAMVQVFAATKGHTVLALAAVGDDGQIHSLLVGVRVQTLPNVFGAISSRSLWYAEPLANNGTTGAESLAELIEEHDETFKRRVLFTEIRPLLASGDERTVLENSGYQYLDYLNYLIDLTTPIDVLWQRVHSSAQSYVRKCTRRGFEVRHVEGPESVDLLYGFLRETYGRAGVPLADRSLFQAAYDYLRPRNMIDFVFVYHEGKPVAADSMLLFKKRVFAWYGGSARITGLSPAAFLQWHEIEWSCACGYETYDFGGAGWPNVPYGVRDFKASFGGDLVSFGRYRKVYSPWKMALAERAYELGRGVLSPRRASGEWK